MAAIAARMRMVDRRRVIRSSPAFNDQNAALPEKTRLHSLAAPRQFDPKRSGDRAVEPDPMPDIAGKTCPAEVAEARCDLARVVEERHVEPEAIGDPAEFPGHQQAVQIAETPTADSRAGVLPPPSEGIRKYGTVSASSSVVWRRPWSEMTQFSRRIGMCCTISASIRSKL